MISITDQPIAVQSVIDAATTPKAGGVSVFIGTIRNHSQNKPVKLLEYEAYEPMAIAEIQKVVDVATQRWGLLGCAVSHRTGSLAPGEVAVVVAVAAPHRKESFAACEFIIDELKAKAPIWKKEVFDDGETWI